jgi:hypothetical protein
MSEPPRIARAPHQNPSVDQPVGVSDPQRFARAIERLDEENGRDPNLEEADGRAWPRELLYARRLYDWVLRLAPQAGEPLLLAARSQHLCRWLVPRASYPEGRAGYLRWRADLKKFHARKAGEVLAECGYPPELVQRVQALNLKQGFPADADTRVLEDALCLVFLEHQLEDLARRSTEDKMVNALRKSWAKMTPAAREIASRLPLGEAGRALLQKALDSAATRLDGGDHSSAGM